MGELEVFWAVQKPIVEAADHDVVLSCEGIHHWFPNDDGSRFHVLHDVNIRIGRGQIVGLVGPSGCGKSTLLRAITGTHLPREGKTLVTSAHERITRPVIGPGRDRGIVYQKYSLFPFLTAQQNVAFGPLLDQTSIPFRTFRPFAWRKLRKRHMEEAAALLEKLGLGFAIRRYPHELSGGMQQRVAIAQALIMKPKVLLMDEPFGALDEATREELQRMLLNLYAENVAAKTSGEPPPHTIVIVTHELNEAIYVADRVIGLSQYWNWAENGHESSPGATIVYDKPAPVYAPDSVRDYELFQGQKEEIRASVMDEKTIRCHRENVDFWQRVQTGDAEGVLAI